MHKVLVNVALVLGFGLTLLIATTYIALESGGVFIAETKGFDNQAVRKTHIWFVEHENRVFLEAGNPNNPWVKDLEAGSTLILRSADHEATYRYVLHRQGRHREIRQLMRQKYGWRDWWVSLWFDTTQSYLIEAEPVVTDRQPMKLR
ncbi:MAG: hypothetical protein AAF541_12110 [Pseudomonadota bacterium]